MSDHLGDDCCYVRATCNYHYSHKGRDVSMDKDEVFLLIKKTTDDWWQVIRSGDNKTFFAPSKYLEVTDVTMDTMKISLRKKMAHQRHLQNQQRLLEESRKCLVNQEDCIVTTTSLERKASPTLLDAAVPFIAPGRANEICHNNHSKHGDAPSPVLLNSFIPTDLIEPPQAFLDANKNESSATKDCSSSTTTYTIDSRPHTMAESQFQISITHAPTVTSTMTDAIAFEELEEPGVSRLNESTDSFSESLKSTSICEKSSVCSTPDKLVASSELEESVSSHTSKSSLNDASRSSIESFSQLKCHMVAKAASFDVLQSEEEGAISPLNGTYPKAASSEELDRRNQRKEFVFQSDRLSHRNRSNSVDLKRFDNNLDLSECEKLISLEKSRKCRLARDPMNRRRSWALNESYSLSSFYKSTAGEQDAAMILDTPPKLPPKMKKSHSSLSCSTDNLHQVGISVEVKIDQEENARQRVTEEKSAWCTTSSFFSDRHPQNISQESLTKEKKHQPMALPRRATPEFPNGASKEFKEQPLDSHDQLSSTNTKFASDLSNGRRTVAKMAETTDTKALKSMFEDRSEELMERREDTLRENTIGDEMKALKEKRVEEMIERIESKTKSTENMPKGKLHIQNPPSPLSAPRRTLFDDWGEYVDIESGRPFYYNTTTREKRWKPPRKSICSSLITDSPPPIPKDKAFTASLRPVKVSSPVLPSHPNIPLWPNRDRSFTIVGSSGSSARSHAGLCEAASVILPATKTSLTLPPSIQHGDHLAPELTKGSYTLPPRPVSPKEPSPTTKSTRSFFSTISSSLSFIKHSSSGSSQAANSTSSLPNHAHPQVPPSSAKPHLGVLPGSPTPSEEDDGQLTLYSALARFHVPQGWTRKYDALSHQVYFESLITGEKWNPAIDHVGNVYVYSATGGKSEWNLPKFEDLSPNSPQSPLLSPTDAKDKLEAVREDPMLWRITMKEGKKAKKSWVTSYARYYPESKKNMFGKSYGYITFSKKLNDYKKLEHFDLVPPCYIDFHQKKQNSLCLRNGDQTEILLQADKVSIVTDWTKLLIEHDKVQEKNLSAEKEKKTIKVVDKNQSKKDALDETDATKGIKEHLMQFFKRRIQQETLAKKGIYKDTVFGSTIGDLCQKEQLNTPVFVLQCIRNIEKNPENFKVDGLYRISGNAPRIQKIRIEIAQNRYGILEEEKDVHNLTGALKLFFRELKEPLIPFASYSSFIQATDHVTSKARTEALRQAVKKLPVCNRDTLKILLDHLLKVNESEQENRMSVMNLAIVFGPCLLWPETTTGFDLMTGAMLHNRVVEALLVDFDEVFKKR